MRSVVPTVAIGPWLLASVLAQAQKPADHEVLVQACNTFAAELHGTLAATGNPTASPASLWFALGTLLPAARGATATEIATALHLPAELRGDRLLAAIGELRKHLGNSHRSAPTHIRFVNDLWTGTNVPVRPEYDAALARFGTIRHSLPFDTDPKAARATINAHVQKATDDRIRELLGPGSIAADTGLVVTTVLLVAAGWSRPFLDSSTKDGAFTLADGTAITVPLMHAHALHDYGESDAWQFVARSLAADLHVEFILPREGKPLLAAERALLDGTAAKQATLARVDLKLPRCTLGGDVPVQAAFTALGVRTAFTDRADFGELSPQPVKLEAVTHRTSIRIDEGGIEAVAATGGRGPTTGHIEVEDKSFHAVRPFAFVVRHHPTGLVLFVGRVDDPRPR